MSDADRPPSRVRPATAADAPAVRALQSLLPEPAPRLLGVGLSAGTVLVSTAPRAGAPTHGGDSGDAPGGVPVGYLLWVGGGDGSGGGGEGDSDGGGTESGRDGGHPSGDGAVHVAELAVAPARRREGRASELLRTLCGTLPPDARVTIAVEASNRAARACYESLGFEAVARREGYFESGPAVVYERRAGGEPG